MSLRLRGWGKAAARAAAGAGPGTAVASLSESRSPWPGLRLAPSTVTVTFTVTVPRTVTTEVSTNHGSSKHCICKLVLYNNIWNLGSLLYTSSTFFGYIPPWLYSTSQTAI